MKNPFPPNKCFVNLREMWEVADICKSSGYEEIREGRLVVTYVCGRPRITVDDALDWMKRMADGNYEPVLDPKDVILRREAARSSRKKQKDATKLRAEKPGRTPKPKDCPDKDDSDGSNEEA